jgi:hypothetical protein
VSLAVAVWARGDGIVDGVVPTICKANQVMHFEIGVSVRRAQEGRRLLAQFTCAAGAEKDFSNDVRIPAVHDLRRSPSAWFPRRTLKTLSSCLGIHLECVVHGHVEGHVQSIKRTPRCNLFSETGVRLGAMVGRSAFDSRPAKKGEVRALYHSPLTCFRILGWVVESVA